MAASPGLCVPLGSASSLQSRDWKASFCLLGYVRSVMGLQSRESLRMSGKTEQKWSRALLSVVAFTSVCWKSQVLPLLKGR